MIFHSSKLMATRKNYSMVEQECLAKSVLWTLRYILLGRRFHLVSDHAPLTWIIQNKHSNARVTRWFLSLWQFNFMVEHRPERETASKC